MAKPLLRPVIHPIKKHPHLHIPPSLHSALVAILAIFTTLMMCSSRQVEAKKLPDIHWNSSNPMFDLSNTDHVKSVRILDRVTIVCPQPARDGPLLHNSTHYEYSKLYLVSREGYDKCELRDEKQLGICATPDQQSSISLVFRDVSPLPSAMEFRPGASYYVITTSTGTRGGLNSSSGGLCARRNMKMKFDVAPTVPSRHDSDSHRPPPSHPSVASKEPLSRREQPILYVIHTSEPELNDRSSSTPPAAPRSTMARELEPHHLPSIDAKGRAVEIIEDESNGGASTMIPTVMVTIAAAVCMLMWR